MGEYRQKRNYENLNKKIFEGAGVFDIPILAPTQYETCELIAFHTCKRCEQRDKTGVHFFLDDYQFFRLWMDIDRYVPMLQEFRCVLTPDFSLYTDFPLAVQIYNHYRKHWVGAYLQEQGIRVIPTLSWSGQQSFEWCFDGEPVGGAVAVSSVGTQADPESKEHFMMGYQEMTKRLRPAQILFYGTVPAGCQGNIIQIAAFQDKFRELRHGR